MSFADISLSSPLADPFLLAADLFDPPRDEDRELAEACAGNLSLMIRQAWPIIEPATPYISSWHIDVVCEHLQAVSDGELPRLLINQPPRTMKSITTGVCWPAWEWMTSPHIRWLFATYAADLSTRDSVKCRRLIESRGGRQDGTLFERVGYQGVLRLLGQHWELTGDQNAKTKYETTATGMRLATSVGGVATGEGGDRIVVDDPLSAKQARSDRDRATANLWWDETMTTRFNNSQAAAVIVMQRLHEQDLTGHLLAKDGDWHHLCLPAEYEPSHPFVYPDKVLLSSGRELPGDRRTEPGELLEPVRLPASRLAELAIDLSSYGYAGQMQQRPSPEAGGMFKRDWWQYWTHANLPPQWQRVIASWDMRFSDHDASTTSYVVGQVWGVNGADRYLLAQIRARLSFTDSVKAVEALAAMFPAARSKLVERKANGAAVIDTLKHKVPGLTPIEPEGGKYVRAGAIEPYVEAGNVYLPDSTTIPVPAGYEPTTVQDFIEEFAVFPNGAHDDQVDAASQALTWLEHRASGISTQSRITNGQPAVVRKGGLTLRGDHHVDKK